MGLSTAFPLDTRFWLLEGVAMIDVVELDERINKCLSILQGNPRSRIFAALAEAYRRRGEVGRAFSVCKNGLRIHPDYGAAHVVMGKLYLHQNMIEQARLSVERAIELEGPSRSSDLLLAEIHMMVGEFKNARRILSNLAQDGANDPAVRNLRERLRDAVQKQEPVSKRETAGDTVHSAPRPPAPQPPEEPVAVVDEISEMDPDTAAGEIKRIPQVICCALWKEDGTLLASQAMSNGEIDPVIQEAWTLFAEVDQHVATRGWGRLSNLRIEDPQGQWGFQRAERMLVLLLGTRRLGYGAAVRKAVQCLGRLASSLFPKESGKPVGQNMAEHLPK